MITYQHLNAAATDTYFYYIDLRVVFIKKRPELTPLSTTVLSAKPVYSNSSENAIIMRAA